MLKYSFKVPACSELLRALVLIPVFILCNVDSYVNNHAVLYTFLFVLHIEYGEATRNETDQTRSGTFSSIQNS